MPIAFTDPIWLWLLLPAGLLVIGGWLAASRTLPRGRRIASLVIRLVLVLCLAASLAGALLALARESVHGKPQEDTAGVVVFGANALVDRLPSHLAELGDPSSVPLVGAT